MTPLTNEWQPHWAVSAGEVIQEKLTELGMTQAECARRIGVSAKHLNRIVMGRSYFSAEMSLRIERVIQVPAVVLVRMQADYQLYLARVTA